ncbi:MAG: hypothetical protein ACI85I_001867 [Arenicella sp.]|jgi:hypothetical protein
MFTCFFWHERHNVRFGLEIQYLEYFFICFAILKVFKNREGNYYQIICLTLLRLLSFLVLFLNGSVIKPMEIWHIVMPIMLVSILFLSVQIIRKDFPLLGKKR